MSTRKTLFVLTVAMLAVTVALPPAAQAQPVDYVDFVGDASALLNLAGRDVLAAVNFWDPDRISDGQRSVDNPIQGVNFDNFACDVDDTGSPFALSSGVPGATLTTIINQSDGREFSATATGVPHQTQLGTFSPQDADNIEAERLAQGGAYYQDKIASDLTFAFGAGYANTTVEVQVVGGGIWNKEPEDPYMGILTFSVDDVDLGYVEDQGYNMQLSTFETTTDANGDLLIDLTLTGDRYCILAGMNITAIFGGVPGDLSGDMDVDLEDVGLFEMQFGSQAPGTYTADFDEDGDVDLDDFLVMRDNLGTGVGPGAPAAAPEPATMTLLALGGMLVLRRRRKA